MRRGIIACPPEASLPEIASALVARRAHTVMVSDETGWSFVSDMELVGAAALGDLGRTASQLATAGPQPLVGVDERLDTAARLVAEGPLGHVVAIDAEGLPVGVLSTLDVLGVIAAG